MTLKQAEALLQKKFSLSCREGGGFGPVEADDEVNDASRRCILACREEHGAAFLGLINAYQDTNGVVQWPWDGKMVFNFGADFVTPAPSWEVLELICEYRRTPIERSASWAEQLEAIEQAITRAGGVMLAWS